MLPDARRSACRASTNQAVSRGRACVAAASFCAASAGSATAVRTSASPFSRRSRAISSASGLTAITWTAGWKSGALTHLVVKSSALPSNTTRSARVATSRSAPRLASKSPRGLSRTIAGAPVAASSSASNLRPARLDNCGLAKMSGRSAAASEERILAQSASPSAARAIGLASGHLTALSSMRASSRSDGRLTCTGPRRPDSAMRMASPISRPRVVTLSAVHDAFVTGFAISAWRNSWKPPRSSSQVAACPDSSTIGDSAASAVYSAPTALAWPGPPVTSAMPASPVSRPCASAMCTAAASWRT